MSRTRAVLETVLASLIWGLAFVAVHDVVRVITPLWLVAIRFLVAALLVLPTFVFTKERRALLGPAELRSTPLAALFLVLTITLQSFGLQITSATNSGFITTLYALFVPFVAFAWMGRRPSGLHLALLGVALVGTALICGFPGGAFNYGDLLTLGCAVTGAFHIVVIARATSALRSPLGYNAMQGLWAGLFALVPALVVDGPPRLGAMGPRELGWLAFLVVISTIFAFLLQIRAQRVIDPQLSSMLFLLESPFAAFFAFILLGETLGPTQWLGAAIILVASAFAVRASGEPSRVAPASSPAR